ncbi:MAG: PE family protein [Mycobacterium sp.]|uniref:PE family protein n=1 Tax=Mycobacterium sp. TaxID=1785 RepID=UPI003F9B31C4
MSYVIAAPEYVAAAATDLANIGSALGDANSAALGPTSSVFAAGADEVSAAISALFNSHAQLYQALSTQAALFHQQFVNLMNGGASEYALTEAANAAPLQTVEQGVLGAINAPGQALTTAQPVAGSAASAASAASAPAATAATAGLAGGSAPATPAAPLSTAVAPASSVPPALVPASAPAAAVQAAPTGSAALVPASTAEAAVPVESGVPSVSGAPASATTSIAAVEAEAPAFSPLTAIPPVPLSGTSLAAAPAVAPPAAAGPAGTSNEQPAVTPASAARAE